jgi:tRNA(adenine34) deaminase
MQKLMINHLAKLDYSAYQIHCQWMAKAREIAEEAGKVGEIPVGAIIIDRNGKLIAQAANCKERNCDPTAHAEILAIQKASKIKQNWHLNDSTLYVTLEPCPMCAGAIIHSRIKLLVYGVDDPKTGAIQTVLNIPDSAASNHKLAVLGGIEEKECRQQLQAWFAAKRSKA